MRILHTADWHIGQMFHGYDRTVEHQNFLNWLTITLQREEIDVLLISGDVFDLSNPAAASIKMFYTFLKEAMEKNPKLQIIVTAGNHDSAHRLEAPKPLLANANVHIIGMIERLDNGEIDYDKLSVPLFGKDGEIKGWCMAVPYLRLGEHPHIKDCENPYIEGVELLYRELYEAVQSKKEPEHCVIAMGHLHALHSEISDADSNERGIMGGLEGISCAAFHSEIKYVALGHIHKAQKIAGNNHIRYCGSPLPMSFTEHQYKHGVLVFEISGDPHVAVQSVEVPLTIRLTKVPDTHRPLPEVLQQLQDMENLEDRERGMAPYLLVRVLLEGPEPALRKHIETALEGKYARLCRIDAEYKRDEKETDARRPKGQLHELRPLDVLNDTYETKYKNKLPQTLEKLFEEVVAEAHQQED